MRIVWVYPQYKPIEIIVSYINQHKSSISYWYIMENQYVVWVYIGYCFHYKQTISGYHQLPIEILALL